MINMPEERRSVRANESDKTVKYIAPTLLAFCKLVEASSNIFISSTTKLIKPVPPVSI
jgi:hypothetical protein